MHETQSLYKYITHIYRSIYLSVYLSTYEMKSRNNEKVPVTS